MAVISGAAIAYHSGEPEFTRGFFFGGKRGGGGSCCSICSILCSVFFFYILSLSFGHCIFFLLAIAFSFFRFTASDYSVVIFRIILFLIKLDFIETVSV